MVDKRRPYYQIYKLKKRENRIEREKDMKIRQPEAKSPFSIPHAYQYDPLGRPKAIEDFQVPAQSPPRNVRVALGLNRKTNRKSRNRQRHFRQTTEGHKQLTEISLHERDDDEAHKKVPPQLLAIQGLDSDSDGDDDKDSTNERKEQNILQLSSPPRLLAANIKSRTSPLSATLNEPPA